jgi:hypothetical protein
MTSASIQTAPSPASLKESSTIQLSEIRAKMAQSMVDVSCSVLSSNGGVPKTVVSNKIYKDNCPEMASRIARITSQVFMIPATDVVNP